MIKKRISVIGNSFASDRTVAVFHLLCTRMRSSVREKQTVHTKIAVMLFLAVVTAVGIFNLFVFVISRMVCKFPNATAKHII